MKEIDTKEIRAFWEGRADCVEENSLGLLTLFSDNEHYIEYVHRAEMRHLIRLAHLEKKPKVLDLGCGVGRTAFAIAPFCSEIVAVDYTKGFIEIAEREAKKRGVTNIDFLVGDICNIKGLGLFDVIIIGGTLIYLTDEQARRVVSVIKDSLADEGRVVAREATGIEKAHSRISDYDEKFGCRYNAKYRTKEEYFALFRHGGLKNVYWNYLFCPWNLGMAAYKKFRDHRRQQLTIKISFAIQSIIDQMLFHRKDFFAGFVKKRYKKIQMVYLYEKEI